MPNVRLPRMWREHTGGVTSIEVHSTTVGEILDELRNRFPGLEGWLDNGRGGMPDYTHVFIDELDARMLGGTDVPIPDEAQLHIVAEMSGGMR